MLPDLSYKSAVIDVGSNSVRLVVFQGLVRHPKIMFNERVLCGLGRDLSKTGEMHAEGVEEAKQTLLRFKYLCEDMEVNEVSVLATAAVRDAKNGPEFADWITDNCGFDVQIISGKREAKLSAYGVLSAFPNAEGLVADLGGGSLELILVSNGEMQDWISLPIGPLRLNGMILPKNKSIRDIIDKAIDSVSWLEKARDKPLYMVGGAWRMMSKLHIKNTHWPSPVLHAYEIQAAAAKTFAKTIAMQGFSTLVGVRQVPSRRLEILPLAASILIKLLKATHCKKVVTSAQGIREGYRFSQLPKEIQRQDPLIEDCKILANRTGRFPEHAQTLMEWIDPVFTFTQESRTDKRLRFAACLLSDISWEGHPDFKAERSFFEAFYGHFIGISHGQRAQLALTLYILFGGKYGDSTAKPAFKLLKPSQVNQAVAVGIALRLGQRLTGGTVSPLKETRLERKKGRIYLHVPENMEAIAHGAVLSRLKSLATHLNCTHKIKVGTV